MNPAEDYILDQNEPYRSILVHLQLMISLNVPNAELKYKYRLPFFYIENKPFCYLNVSQKKKYVDLGFWNAAHLTKHTELMITEGRKVMKSLRYNSLDDINEEVLVDVLLDAYKVRTKGFFDKN